MPRRLANATPPSRYSYQRVREEIARRIRLLERGTTVRLAAAMAIEPHQFSHRLRGLKARFTIEQIGVIADEIVPGGAPTAWPYIPWEWGLLVDGAVPKARVKKPPARPARTAAPKRNRRKA